MAARTLKDYRPQHDDGCAINDGYWIGRESSDDFGGSCVEQAWVSAGHLCSCGLDALFTPAEPQTPEPATATGEQRAVQDMADEPIKRGTAARLRGSEYYAEIARNPDPRD